MEHLQVALWTSLWAFILIGYFTTNARWLIAAGCALALFTLTGTEPFEHMAAWGKWATYAFIGVVCFTSLVATFNLSRGKFEGYMNFFRVRKE